MKFLLFLLNLVVLSFAAEEKLVKLSLYYESLCPDSRAFTLNHLGPTYEQLNKYISLELVPFGNVNVTLSANHTPAYQCQHGEAECYGNRLEACVIFNALDDYTALNFVRCMFVHNNWTDTYGNGEKCFSLTLSDWTPVKRCIDGKQGADLIEINWKKTSGLNPKKTAVPWIVINGKHTPEMQKEAEFGLFKYLCANELKNVPECGGH